MLKRLLDIVIASSALVLLSPVYALVAYKVKKNPDWPSAPPCVPGMFLLENTNAK